MYVKCALRRAFSYVGAASRALCSRVAPRRELESRRDSATVHGFTLVELLVVIAIIGILVALLLPAIQAAREAARRASCTNNLKNLGLAVLNHHDIKKQFPVSMGYPESNENGPCVGWILNTLPQLEEQSLYDQFVAAGAFEGNFAVGACKIQQANRGIASTKNGIRGPELAKTQLPILQCPSDTSVLELSVDQYQWQPKCPVALTSYKGVIDDTVMGETDGTIFTNDGPYPEYASGLYTEPKPAYTSERDCHRDTRCRGIFFRQSFKRPVKIATVTDGTSKTVMIGEDIPEFNLHSAAFYSNGDTCSCNTPLNYGLNQNPEIFRIKQWEARGFRSRHPGGVHFCLVDGSVRFLADDVDNVLYRISCTRNGNESLGENL
jgi:prepilin-type N-terminal cleavage/methylation domain-containing protein/prepilin-type processing-associated H-X9-DG protein